MVNLEDFIFCDRPMAELARLDRAWRWSLTGHIRSGLPRSPTENSEEPILTIEAPDATIGIPTMETLVSSAGWSRARAWRSFLRSRTAQVGVLCTLAVVMLAAFGPMLSNDPFTQHLVSRLEPPLWAGGADRAHIFGTDSLGRDVFTRIAFGARISLFISVLAVLISGTLGTLIGVYAGYYGGRLDSLMMRLADIQLAFPFILLVILLVGTLGPSLKNVVMVLGISGWVLYARIVRGQTLSLREKEFVEASRALGMGDTRIIFRHILPNVMSPVIVVASFATAQMIIIEASLSFLGLGVQPPNPSLGNMLAEGKLYLVIDPWLSTLPGLTIMVAVLGVNLLGDWLRDLLDPRELTRTA